MRGGNFDGYWMTLQIFDGKYFDEWSLHVFHHIPVNAVLFLNNMTG